MTPTRNRERKGREQERGAAVVVEERKKNEWKN
jgi:hypothetical protein